MIVFAVTFGLPWDGKGVSNECVDIRMEYKSTGPTSGPL